MYLIEYKTTPHPFYQQLLNDEASISEHLFYAVQDFLDGKKKTYRTQVTSQDVFHLKGFLLCPKCGKLLTGSASKGRNGKYNYYHCHSKCGTRFKSEHTNELFCAHLRKLVPHPAAIESYSHVIKSTFASRNKDQRSETSRIKIELEKINSRLAKARDLLLDNDLDPTEYKQIKAECEKKIQHLESTLFDTSTRSHASIDALLDKGLAVLSQLDDQYYSADPKKKRKVIGSIFPEKIVFDGTHFRTARMNELVRLVYSLDAGLSEKKIGEHSVETEFSYLVDLYGFEP